MNIINYEPFYMSIIVRIIPANQLRMQNFSYASLCDAHLLCNALIKNI